jgi:hypothetical protein
MPDREQPQPPARYRHVEVLTVNLALWLIIAAYGVIISWVLLAWRVIRVRPRLEQDELGERAHQVSRPISARLEKEPDLAPPRTTSPKATEIAELERLWRLPAHRATPRGH